MRVLGEELLSYWNEQVVQHAGDLLVRTIFAVLAAALVLVLARTALGAVRRALGRTRAHANARLLVDRLIQFGGLLLGAAWVLAIFGVELTALVALVGVAGLAVSLALQDVLKNLVAGLYILIERPFAIGEQIDFRTYSGHVETIELRTTALRTAGGQRVIIPNAMLVAEALVNRSTYGRQLVRLRVATPIDGDPRRVLDEVRAAVESAAAAASADGGGGGTAPAVVLEAVTAEKLTLRAEVWAVDARQATPQVALAIRERLPAAEITVIE